MMLALIAWALQDRVETAWHWALIGAILVTTLSALPVGVYFVSYGITLLLTLAFRRRVWQVPLLAMFGAVFAGTLITHAVSWMAVWLQGTLLPTVETLNLVTLPSLMLNLLLAVPVYIFIADLAHWVHPKEIEA
jgi:hypothetical protein